MHVIWLVTCGMYLDIIPRGQNVSLLLYLFRLPVPEQLHRRRVYLVRLPVHRLVPRLERLQHLFRHSWLKEHPPQSALGGLRLQWLALAGLQASSSLTHLLRV